MRQDAKYRQINYSGCAISIYPLYKNNEGLPPGTQSKESRDPHETNFVIFKKGRGAYCSLDAGHPVHGGRSAQHPLYQLPGPSHPGAFILSHGHHGGTPGHGIFPPDGRKPSNAHTQSPAAGNAPGPPVFFLQHVHHQ